MIRTLTRLDWELENNVAGRERAVQALRLIPRCFPRYRVRVLPVLAITATAYKRWASAGRATMPPQAVINAMSRYNWEAFGEKHGYGMDEFPSFEAQADKRWPA